MILARDADSWVAMRTLAGEEQQKLADHLTTHAKIPNCMANGSTEIILATKEQPVLLVLGAVEYIAREDQWHRLIPALSQPELFVAISRLQTGLSKMGLDLIVAHSLKDLPRILTILSDPHAKIIVKSALEPFRYNMDSNFYDEWWSPLTGSLVKYAVGFRIVSIVQEHLERIYRLVSEGKNPALALLEETEDW